MQTANATTIENLLQQLVNRRNTLEEQVSPSEKLRVVLTEKWEPIEKMKVEDFSTKLSRFKQIVRLEIAIYESIKDEVDPSIAESIKEVLAKVRYSNDLMGMNGVSLRHRDNVKLRQVIKLVNAVYRYNRDSIVGFNPSPTIKSRIKHASLCPHCGEIARGILFKMASSGAILLP